jgi:hypothetical protein
MMRLTVTMTTQASGRLRGEKEFFAMSAEIKQILHEVRNRLHQIRDYL